MEVMTKGTRYGQLTYLRPATPNRFHKRPAPSGLFECDCGVRKVIPLTRVRVGNSRSCGCAMRKTMRGLINAHYAEFAARKTGAK
jgi:hypothetical protein